MNKNIRGILPLIVALIIAGVSILVSSGVVGIGLAVSGNSSQIGQCVSKALVEDSPLLLQLVTNLSIGADIGPLLTDAGEIGICMLKDLASDVSAESAAKYAATKGVTIKTSQLVQAAKTELLNRNLVSDAG